MSELITIHREVHGLSEFLLELRDRTVDHAKEVLTKGVKETSQDMKRALSKRDGPAPPGQPPALEEGHLRRSIGYTKATVDQRLVKSVTKTAGGVQRGKFSQDLVISARVGVAIGQGYRNFQKSLAEGVNVFEYALLQEQGGFTLERTASERSGARTFVRIPAHPFVEPSIEKLRVRLPVLWDGGA